MHRKFTRFIISAEAENANETADVGTFDLQEDTLTKFADNCANAVMETSKMEKENISVAWTSPMGGSGCILFRATVLETSDTWYMDSNLNFQMCQDLKAETDDEGDILYQCCACDEAKFEVTFEGLWSRNTHPKDFPSKGWTIRFSDVIGASHTGSYRFWRYNEKASEGLRSVAEFGTTRKLESELKNQSENIRTIIKARGISYPNVTGRTFAVFRVDNKHHLMSLVSMIVPSPDWFVGVSGLELCLPNCSWIEHKELNLYPYDAGTDDGLTYLSPDTPVETPKPIQRITSKYPNDSRSPFYDPSGLDMKPLAKLYLNRQRLYEKTCDSIGDTLTDTEACRVSSWGEWSECSVTCGRGIQLKQRHFRDEVAAEANKCNTSLTDRKICYNTEKPNCINIGYYDELLKSEKCELTTWSSWSSCSSTCGKGSMTRSRNFRQKKYRKQCKAVPNGPRLEQSMDCKNKPCEGEDMEEVRQRQNNGGEDEDYTGELADGTREEWLQKCPDERYSQWSTWTPCTSSCGPGVKMRSRILLHKDTWNGGSEDGEDDGDSHEECKMQQADCYSEISSCDITKEEAKKICNEPKKEGTCHMNPRIWRAYFDKQTGRCHLFGWTGCDGNRNNFPTVQDCYAVCGNFQKEDFKGIEAGSQIMESSENGKVDCQVSEWNKWSRCETCRGYTTSTRQIMMPAKNGGKKCPKKMLKKKKCHKIPPCSLQGDGTGRRFHRAKNTSTEISEDCKVTSWSKWSKCSVTCGEGLRNRIRSVMKQPKGVWAKLCPPLVEFKKCYKVDCPQ
ncbi:hypothetical protein P5V15_010484 [Pogonomyrmex californicus]